MYGCRSTLPAVQVSVRSDFGAWGIQGRSEAAMIWVWDTKNLDPGPHTLSFSVQPQGITWTEQVNLLPSAAMPPAEAEAHWAETTHPMLHRFLRHQHSFRTRPAHPDHVGGCPGSGCN